MSGLLRRLAAAEKDLDTAKINHASCRERSDRLTPGGLHGDQATLSGVRRRPNGRLDERRYRAYDAEAEAGRILATAEARVRRLKAEIEQAEIDAKALCDVDGLAPGDYVRDRHGWHRVARVNAKSVSVETQWSWTDRIERGRIIETRKA